MTNPNPTNRTGEPRLASIASWAVLVASFGLSASTWVALALLAGFTDRYPIPYLGITVALAWLMPIAVDGYVVVALVLWMSPVPAQVAQFAKKNTYFAAGTGIAAQSAYHLLHTMSTDVETWRVVLAAVVGALPPTVAALAIHMRALIRRTSVTATTAAAAPESAAPAPTPQPTSVPSTPVPSTAVPSTAVPSTAVPSTAVPSIPARPSAVPDPEPVPVTRPADLTRERPESRPEPDATPRTGVDTPAPATDPTRGEVPTPVQVATRITRPRPANPPITAAPGAERRTTGTPATSTDTTATPSAPSTTDIPVTASDAARPAQPTVSPDLLARATRVARHYYAEHGTAITAGQLAARLRVGSDIATQALAVIALDPNTNPTVTTVNGNPVKATR